MMMHFLRLVSGLILFLCIDQCDEIVGNTEIVFCFQLVSSIGSFSARPDPPTLKVSGISQTAATIRFQSEYDSVVYSFRYRRETGDDDDEKESQWIEQVLDNGVDQYTLNGLQRNSKYELIGKLVRNMVSSSASDLISFETLDHPPFEWDPARKHDSLMLSDHNRTVTSTSGRTGWFAVVSKNKVNLGSVKSLEWEITMRNFGNYPVFMAGWGAVNAAYQISMDSCLGQKRKRTECAFYVHSSYFSKYEKSQKTKFDAEWRGDKCKSGDRILFKFQGSRCTLYCNGTEVGVLSDCTPTEIYLAASTYNGITLETTKFEISSGL